MTTVFTYTKSPFAIDQLDDAIRASSLITIALANGSTLLGSVITVTFRTDLPDDGTNVASITCQPAVLANLVAANSGIATPAPAQAVTPNPFVDNTTSGTLNAAGQSIWLSTSGCSSVQYYTRNTASSATWVGTIITEVSYDTAASVWVPVPTVDTDPSTNLLMTVWGNSLVPSFNNDPWEVNVSATTNFRLRVVDYTSGSLDVFIISSAAASDVAQPSSDRWSSGMLSALSASQTGATAGCSSCTVAVTGTWVGTVAFQASIDNHNFFAVAAIDIATGFQVTRTTANGHYLVPCGGYNTVSAVMTAYTSGSATVAFDAGEGSNSGIYPVEIPFTYLNLTGNATTTVKSGVGRLHSVGINNNATGGTVTIYDSTAASGTIMMTLSIGTPAGGLLSTAGVPPPLLMGPYGPSGLPFSNGLTVVTTGSLANNITVYYQ